MPARETATFHNGLKFRAEPVDEPDPVYWTSDVPEFDVHILNNDARDDYAEGSEFRWFIESEPGEAIHSGKGEFGPLDDGEETTVRVGGSKLSYDGHCVFGVKCAGATGLKDSHRKQLKPGTSHSTISPMYSFAVWDKSDYRARVTWPKRLQIVSLVLTGALLLFGLLQILLASGIL